MGQMSGISLSNPPVVMSERALDAMQGYKSIGRKHLVRAHNFLSHSGIPFQFCHIEQVQITWLLLVMHVINVHHAGTTFCSYSIASE